MIDEKIKEILKMIGELKLDDKINALNSIKLILHEASPFKDQPVDCVLWVKSEDVKGNKYNPNSVARPEMELLEHSILSDNFTQPIVSWESDGSLEVIDGFHRHLVGKNNKEIKERIHGYLPIVKANKDRVGKPDRIAATIRHNRARGKHMVDSMSDIVIELKRRNWSDKKIGKELGMDQDEVLRLTQIGGLSEMFADRDFSEAWQAELYDDEIIEFEDEENIS